MLAIARAMMLEPKIILLDEPTEGLMPRMVGQISSIIDMLHREGVAILLVEQNVPLTLEASSRVYIMEKGVVRHHAPSGRPPRQPRGHPPVPGGVATVAIPLEQILIQTVNGIVNGMILALVASGLTLIFGIMDVVNFAHGDLVMLGGFVGAATIATTGNFWLALLVAAVVIAVFGAVLQATTLRPLIGRDPLTTILATFGISLVLQKYAIWQWGPSARRIQEPITGNFSLFYLQYPWYRILTAVLATAIIGALYLFLRYGSTASGFARRRRTGSWPRPWASRFLSCTLRSLPSGGHGRRLRRALRPPRRRDPEHRSRLHPARLHRGGGGRHGQSGRLHPRVHLHQPARSLCRPHRQPRPGGDRVLRGPDPDPALPAHRLFVPTPK
jgi:energy-coupling factor transporter ATP-binding protein EcfA2